MQFLIVNFIILPLYEFSQLHNYWSLNLLTPKVSANKSPTAYGRVSILFRLTLARNKTQKYGCQVKS